MYKDIQKWDFPKTSHGCRLVNWSVGRPKEAGKLHFHCPFGALVDLLMENLNSFTTGCSLNIFLKIL